MSSNLMKAILSLYAYNSADTSVLNPLSNVVGNWVGQYKTDANDEGFLAVAFKNGKDWMISYKGTSNYSLDIVNGWGVGLGQPAGPDAVQAVEFYKFILSSTAVGDSIATTGHSMGGGFAGLIASLYGGTAVIFDNMPYQLAAQNAYTAAVGTGSFPAIPGFAQFLYGAATPRLPIPQAITAYETVGEALSYIRYLGPNETIVSLNPNTEGTLGTVQLHDLPLLIMLMYANQNGLTGWQPIANYMFSKLWDRNVAAAAGVRDFMPDAYKYQDEDSALRQMIAYSAIDEGNLLFGNAAVGTLFDDAVDLAKLVPASESSVTHIEDLLYGDLSAIAVQYAGQVAGAKLTAGGYNGRGIVESAGNVVSIDLNPQLTHANSALEIVGAKAAIIDAVIGSVGRGTESTFDDAFTNLFGSRHNSLISQVTLIKATGGSDVILNGRNAVHAADGSFGGALLIGSSDGRTKFEGGLGTNFMVGQNDDIFDLSVGNNFIFVSEGGTATLDASSVVDPRLSQNWNFVEGTETGDETFTFDAANAAPLTIVYGGGGSDSYKFSGTENPDDNAKIGVYILQFDAINATNFLQLDPVKINKYITDNYDGVSNQMYPEQFDNRIILINPSQYDKIYYEDQMIGTPTTYLMSNIVSVTGTSFYAEDTVRRYDGTVSVSPNYLKKDNTGTSNTYAYFTDQWDIYTKIEDRYGAKSGNTAMSMGQASSLDHENVKTQNRIQFRKLNSGGDTITYDYVNEYGSHSGVMKTYNDLDYYPLELIGFNNGDFGIDVDDTARFEGEEIQYFFESYKVSEWAEAEISTWNGFPMVDGTSPASLGEYLGPTYVAPQSIDGKFVADSTLDRPILHLSDFMSTV